MTADTVRDARQQGEAGEARQQDVATQARQREIATEHLLFKLMEYVEARHAGLLDFMEESLDHLGDPANDRTKDDEAVRRIAAKMIAGARRQGVG